MALLRALIAGPEPLSRRTLSIEFCRRVGWLKSDGGLKDMMARVAMLAMHRDGLIELPPPRWQRGRPKPIVFGPDTEPPLFPAPIAMFGFSTAAWKLAPRDSFIGWTPAKREKNVHLVVDNPRFLILPWIEIPNLGSHILALVRRRLPLDWTERYGTTPALIETFVETPRYTGAVYWTSGWTRVGTTQGRGRYDRHTKRAQPKKDIWLRPLRKDWQRTLNR